MVLRRRLIILLPTIIYFYGFGIFSKRSKGKGGGVFKEEPLGNSFLCGSYRD